MEDVFFKSALPAHDSLMLGCSSLALPGEPTPASSSEGIPNGRSLRVQQQVRLTLARRARKTLPTGSVHLQKNTTKSFDTKDGLLPNTKVGGLNITSRSFSSNHLQKPSRRLEVSPPTTPEFPLSPFKWDIHRYWTYTHPGPSHSRWAGSLPDRSLGSDSFRRHTASEAPCKTGFHASTVPVERFHQKSLRWMAAPRPVFANEAFQQSVKYGSGLSHSHAVEQERRIAQGQSGEMMLGANQPDEVLAWLAQVRREGQERRRMSHTMSPVASMEVDMGRQLEVESPIQQTQDHNVKTLKSKNKPPEMTLERAVNLLTHENEDTVVCAANHIQNQCFRRDDAKKIVYYLRGIEKLLRLLCSDNEIMQRVTAGALRNVVYQNNENKMEVNERGGLATILNALKSSRDVETRRELTGLLWNLSSHDLLKERFSKEALSVLTKSVLVPSSGISEGENPKDDLLADAAVFYNATGCLRNLSSAGPDGRRAMRECENLIDSLVYYVRGAIADYKTDDKSTENCVCILHNLSYQMEAELPKMYTRDLRGTRQNLAPNPQAVGCFPLRSAKIAEHLELECPLLEENANPLGIEWLWSTITIRMYLSLMARSMRHGTQEAAIGALQNITAGNGAVSEAINFTIVQRENGLQHVKKMILEGESDVKRTAIFLIRNLSRYHELHPNIVKHVLPEVVEMLPNDDTGSNLPTEVTVSLCQILNNLSQSDRQHVRAIVNEGALPNIISISRKDNGYGPTRAGQAACVLLHTMWRHDDSDLHGFYKRCGYKKTDFINARTIKGVNSG